MEARKRCPYYFERGKKKGQQCVRICKNTIDTYCYRHRKFEHKAQKPAEDVVDVAEDVVDVIEDIIEEKIEEKLEDIIEEVATPEQDAEILDDEAFAEKYFSKPETIPEQIPENNIEDPSYISADVKDAIRKIRWKKFNKSMMDFNKDTGRSCVVFGSSYSGKTHFVLNNMIDNYCGKDRITLLQADNIQSHTYSKVPKHIIKVDTYMPDLLKAFKYIQSKTKSKYQFVSITDDIVCGLRNNSVIRKCFLSWRNSKISSINLFQSLTLINKTERSSISYIVLKQVNDMGTIRDIIEWWLLQSKIFYDLKMNDRMVLYRQIMQDKSNAILIDNIKGEIHFIKHK